MTIKKHGAPERGVETDSAQGVQKTALPDWDDKARQDVLDELQEDESGLSDGNSD